MNTFSNRLAIVVLAISFVVSGSATTTLKIATISPDNSVIVENLRTASDNLFARTDGEVKLKIYANGVMGDDLTVKRKIRARQLQGGIVATQVFATEVPDLNLYNLPLQFKDLDEVNVVRQEFDSWVKQQFDNTNFVPIGFIGIGFAYAMSTKPFDTVEETYSLKIWTPKDDRIADHTLRTFGTSPIPLTVVDVLPSLQTGLIDTIASPPVAAIALQWHAQVKYILNIPFTYVYIVVVLDRRSFNRLTEFAQEILLEELQEVVTNSEVQLYKDQDDAFSVMQDHGVELLDPDPDSLNRWNQAAKKAIDQMRKKGYIPEDPYRKLQEVLQDYRTQSSR